MRVGELFKTGNTSEDIIRVSRSIRIRWVGHVERVWQSRNACRNLVGEA